MFLEEKKENGCEKDRKNYNLFSGNLCGERKREDRKRKRKRKRKKRKNALDILDRLN